MKNIVQKWDTDNIHSLHTLTVHTESAWNRTHTLWTDNHDFNRSLLHWFIGVIFSYNFVIYLCVYSYFFIVFGFDLCVLNAENIQRDQCFCDVVLVSECVLLSVCIGEILMTSVFIRCVFTALIAFQMGGECRFN